MINKLTCTIKPLIITYDIEVYQDFISTIETLCLYLKNIANSFAIITDNHIAELFGYSLKNRLQDCGLDIHLFAFPQGEQYKIRMIKDFLEDQMFDRGFGKDSCIIALGGGVVTDIAGFVASTFCRGISFVSIPTTLLGMVDASMGGKNGINVPYGKNLIGTIYQPKKIFINLDFLHHLSRREFKNGCVEMIKHALIFDKSYFDFLESQVKALFHLNSNVLQEAILKSCMIKKEIIEQDEKENARRHLLNFGHTIGHALETLTEYSISHGEAVAIGIMVDSYISVLLGKLEQTTLDRIRSIFSQFGISFKLPSFFSYERIKETLKFDKKAIQEIPRFVILEQIGKPFILNENYCHPVDDLIIMKAIQWMYNDLCSH